MRVAQIGSGTLTIPPNGWGATQRVIWNLHQRGREAGFESIIVNSRQPEEIRAQCLACAPDVVHLHAHAVMTAALPYLIECPTPLVATSHDYRVADTIPLEVQPLVASADAVIALSPAIRERFRALRPGGVHYVPNGVDNRIFRPLAKRKGSVLAVGRNTQRKRFAEIARFFLERPEYQLTLCGPDMQALPGQGRPVIPTGPNIRILGNSSEDEVARLLGESEYFVHLCKQEASPLVVREAMACGCRVWTVPENAQDLKNVALSWEEALADPELGVRAAREARESFDWSTIAAQHARVYAETLAQWRASPTAAADAQRRYRHLAAQATGVRARLRAVHKRIHRGLRPVVDALRRRREQR